MTLLLALLLTVVPIPQTPHAYVTDNVHAITPQTNAQVTGELQNYEKTTGHRVIVWIGDTTGDAPLEDWTIRAAEQWKMFRTKGRDDGAILFIFMQDHKVRIEVGYGLESALTDAAASRIIRNTIVPKMRAGDADAAVRNGVDAVLLTITPSFAEHVGHPVASPASASGDARSSVIAFIILCAIFIFMFVMIGGAMSRRRGRSSWIFGSGFSPWMGSSGGGSSGGGGGFGGGFSGGFGGGGASGGW